MKKYKNHITSKQKTYKQGFKKFYCYWGTWCRMVNDTEPHYPKYKEYMQYKMTCIKANIGYETLEQARKNPYKIQTGTSCEYYNYYDLYYKQGE